MTTTTDVTGIRSTADTALVLGPNGLEERSIRGWDRMLAAIVSARLDAQLAAGQAPESRWLRAVRATQLVRPARRRGLADAWAAVLDGRHQTLRRRYGTAVHPSVRDSNHLVVELVDRLAAAAPVSPRGVAAATLLLTDGTGPLFRPRSAEHLSAALAAVLHQLDPYQLDPYR